MNFILSLPLSIILDNCVPYVFSFCSPTAGNLCIVMAFKVIRTLVWIFIHFYCASNALLRSIRMIIFLGVGTVAAVQWLKSLHCIATNPGFIPSTPFVSNALSGVISELKSELTPEHCQEWPPNKETKNIYR